MIGERISASEMQLGDVVEIANMGAWNTVIVQGISDEQVELHRPYMTSVDWSGSWGRGGESGQSVITYIGTEVWCESRKDEHKRFILRERKTLR